MPDPQPTPQDQPTPKSVRKLLVQPNPTEIPPSQPTMDARFFRMAENWAAEQLMLIPELEAVVIIPSWAVDVNLPCGLIKDRRGGKMHAAEMLRMVHQIHEVYAGQVRRMGEMLAGFDQIAGRLADEITAREQRLAELDQQIAERTKQE